jgi:hypothetical protein
VYGLFLLGDMLGLKWYVSAVSMAAKANKEMGTFFSLSKSATSFDLEVSEVALLLFGVLLVVGLIGEYADSDRWKKYVKVFEMLVIIGVAGELLADGGIFLFSSHLQTIADEEIVELTKKAGDAKISAEGAATAADRAKTSADNANTVSGKALDKSKVASDAAGNGQKKADAVAKQADDLLRKYVEAAQKLEDEKRKRLALAASLLPRTFPDQSGAAAKLIKFPAPNSVLLKYRDDEDSTSMAEQINAVTLGILRWNSCRLRESEAGIATGVTCRPALAHPLGSPPYTPDDWRKAQEQKVAANNLCSAVVNVLQGSGVDAKVGFTTSRIPPRSIEIDVGSKPNRAAEETIRELATPSSEPTLLGNFLMDNSRQAILGGEPPPPTIDKNCNPVAQK